MRENLKAEGYLFASQTDSEVIGCLIDSSLKSGMNLIEAVSEGVKKLEGTYAFCVLSPLLSGSLVVARQGSPVVIGLGIGEHFVASDVLSLIHI